MTYVVGGHNYLKIILEGWKKSHSETKISEMFEHLNSKIFAKWLHSS